jgi:hypothetical protein
VTFSSRYFSEAFWDCVYDDVSSFSQMSPGGDSYFPWFVSSQTTIVVERRSEEEE